MNIFFAWIVLQAVAILSSPHHLLITSLSSRTVATASLTSLWSSAGATNLALDVMVAMSTATSLIKMHRDSFKARSLVILNPLSFEALMEEWDGKGLLSLVLLLQSKTMMKDASASSHQLRTVIQLKKQFRMINREMSIQIGSSSKYIGERFCW